MRRCSGYDEYAPGFRYVTVNTNAPFIADCAVKYALFQPPNAMLKKVGLSTISSTCFCVYPLYRPEGDPNSTLDIVGTRLNNFSACRSSNGTCCGTRSRRGVRSAFDAASAREVARLRRSPRAASFSD